jgi:phosphoglycerate dehydrogenase-like enzyme
MKCWLSIRTRTRLTPARNEIELVPLNELFRRSDFITLHVPLTAETRHMIGSGEIAMMRPVAVLIQRSRGGLIDERAAYDAHAAGKLGGLGLDAYETEPPEASPLFALDSVVATPHTARIRARPRIYGEHGGKQPDRCAVRQAVRLHCQPKKLTEVTICMK